jgi:hypothetical protein
MQSARSAQGKQRPLQRRDFACDLSQKFREAFNFSKHVTRGSMRDFCSLLAVFCSHPALIQRYAAHLRKRVEK